jgi:dGTPase
MLADMEEIWTQLQVGRLHRDRRVVSANLHAARLVSTLVVASALLPELIDNRFRSEYSRLEDSSYLKHYVGLAGQHVEIPARLMAQLPVSLLIGAKFQPGQPARIRTAELIMAKDYVAGLTDSRASAFYEQVVSGHMLSSA